jgi:hypothetical protein
MSRECPQPRGGGRGRCSPTLFPKHARLQVAAVAVAAAVHATTVVRRATCRATVRRRVKVVDAVSPSVIFARSLAFAGGGGGGGSCYKCGQPGHMSRDCTS